MNHTKRLLFIAFFAQFIIVTAQEVDSLSIEKPLDSLTLEIDTTEIEKMYDSLILEPRESGLDSVLPDTLKVPQRKKPRMITIERAMLDSLLRPYYDISIDSIVSDSITRNVTFTPKYRMKVDPETKDTMYVPLPKSTYFINVLKTYGIDTIEIPTAIELVSVVPKKNVVEPEWWEYDNSIGFDLNQVSFVNWNSGGENSVSGLLKIYFSRNYEKLYTIWKNEISARYGLNQREDQGLIKTDDEIKLSSSFGYRKDTLSNWYYTARFSFRTQFTDGFNNPEDEEPISRFFAPAYFFLGVGSTYNLKEELLSVYLSPFTFKSTYVLDTRLSEEGAFGVNPGSNARHELGFLVRTKWDKELLTNMAMTNELELYSDYINNFGNIDVDWILTFKFKINNLLEANFRTHLIYDDDIKIKETNDQGEVETLGARVQLKQQLGIGILYSF